MKKACKFCKKGEFIVADGCLPDMKKPERLETLGFMEAAIFGVWHDWDGDGHWLMFDNSCGEYADGGVLIRYCPFCGRRLRDDRKENSGPDVRRQNDLVSETRTAHHLL